MASKPSALPFPYGTIFDTALVAEETDRADVVFPWRRRWACAERRKSRPLH
jgi:hypothetical protein